MITIAIIIVFFFVFILLMVTGAYFLGIALALAGLIISALNFSKAKKLKPSSKKCPKCGSENIVISAGEKRRNNSIAVCQNCADRFEYWTSHDIQKEIKDQKTKTIIFSIILGLLFLISIGSLNRKNYSSQQVSNTTSNNNTQESSTDQSSTSGITQKQDKKSEYTVTNGFFEIYTDSIDNKRFYGIVEVKNTGTTDLYLDAISFDVEDDNGHLVATEKTIGNCPDVISPGEVGYLYTSFSGRLPDEMDMSAHYTMSYNLDIKRATKSPTIYKVSDLSSGTGSFGYPSVTGRVTNDSGSDDSLVYIEVVYYNEKGTPIAVEGTNVTNLKAGTTQSFEISGITLGSYIDKSEIASYKVFARKNHIQF